LGVAACGEIDQQTVGEDSSVGRTAPIARREILCSPEKESTAETEGADRIAAAAIRLRGAWQASSSEAVTPDFRGAPLGGVESRWPSHDVDRHRSSRVAGVIALAIVAASIGSSLLAIAVRKNHRSAKARRDRVGKVATNVYGGTITSAPGPM